MKRLLLITLLPVAIATAIGILQHRQLGKLRSYANALRDTNTTLATPPHSAPSTAATPSLDPADFLQQLAALNSSTPPETAHALYSMLTAASPEALREILAALDDHDLPETVRDRAAMLAIINLVVHQPGFAADASIQYIDQSGFLEHFIKTFAHNHPHTAASWFTLAKAQNRLPADRPDLLANIDKKITAGIARTDPARALAHAEAAAGEHRYDLLHAAARFIDDEDAWLTLVHGAANHADPEFRATALRAIGNGTAGNSDFDDTRHLIPRLDLPPALMNGFILQAATRTIDNKTPERASWLIANSTPDSLDHNIASLVTAWTNRDFNATATWLSSLEPSAVRDTAIAEFSSHIAHREPTTAADWAITIAGAEKKRATLDAILTNWQKTDPAAAKAYLDFVAP